MVITNPQTKVALARAMGERLRTDRLQDGALADVVDADVARSHARITGAPVVILVSLTMADMDQYPDDSRNQAEYLMAVQSTAMAGQNLLLAAHAAGLGACWLCAPLFCPQVVTEAIDLPVDWQPQGIITLGYPANEGKARSRRPMAEVTIHRGAQK